ncbi:hypothetical protein [Actinomadura verrucosospora]|uniref:Uncharacterized protein n=1 Tax=Actinomadura verrucosospora TaxID=46165 RepID=A0A7D3W3B7_ACTVE|nr:hypothetical protein [Actinomadura verrucosospora]QKG25216.1 hypothetical protein ACTIVE_6867 [Actinomadura verrucosospora]
MPGTHGSASQSIDGAIAFAWDRPDRADLDRTAPTEGTVFDEAVRRARTERREARRVSAGFDNRLL